MLAFLMFGNVKILINRRSSNEHLSYSRYNIAWFSALILMNFSYIFVEIIMTSIDAIPIELDFESLKN